MQKKNILFIFFSFNLPAGILSSVLKNFLLKFCVQFLFFEHYFSPLNSFMRKGSGSGSVPQTYGFGSPTLLPIEPFSFSALLTK